MCSVSPIELTASKPVSGDVAVVEVADLGEVVEPVLARSPSAPTRPARATASRRARGRRTRAAAWRTMPPQPQPTSSSRMPGWRPSLRATRSYLACLRLLERGVLGRVDRAGVGHRRAEHHLVEAVGHVVVVLDRPCRRAPGCAGGPRPAGASAAGAPAAAGAAAPGGSARSSAAAAPPAAGDGPAEAHRPQQQRPCPRRGRRGGSPCDVEVAGDVGPGQPRSPGRGDAGRRARARSSARGRSGRPRARALPSYAVKRTGTGRSSSDSNTSARVSSAPVRLWVRSLVWVIVVAPPCRRGSGSRPSGSYRCLTARVGVRRRAGRRSSAVVERRRSRATCARRARTTLPRSRG